MRAERRIGLTSTVPLEVILAGGGTPVDLNNRFITSPARERLLGEAEARGFPVNLCAWIKGIYAVAREENLSAVVGVARGDCSSTEKLLEVWRAEGLAAISFSYPLAPDVGEMREELERFAGALGVSLAEAEAARKELLPVRALLRELDERSFETGQVLGQENHLWLVSASDFNSHPQRFARELECFLEEVRGRPRRHDFLRLGYVGVPPIVDDLYQFLESQGARVIFNETQRQFAMLGEYADLAEQYTAYTYPYETAYRMRAIKKEIERRELVGVIHYAQTFCHRQLESLLFRPGLGVPVLSLEADKPGPLEPRAKTRIQAFLEQLSAKKSP